MKLACVFPGQGSQSIGMLSELATSHSVVGETFQQAAEILGIDLWSMVVNGPEAELNSTINTQPVMLATSVAVWRIWQQRGGCQPEVMAGHSFGEYSALVCAGSLKFTDAIKLVRERGRLMQSAMGEAEGAMAAILGLDDATVIELCAQAASGQVVQAANFNSPGQVVIAGDADAVDRAVAAASDAGAKRAIKLAVSVPAHTSLMQAAADEFVLHLNAVQIAPTLIPVLHNVDVKSYNDPAMIRDALSRQLYNPVRWVETIQNIAAAGVTTVLEMGPGKVLTGLNKRIDKSLKGLCVQDAASLEQGFHQCEETA